jgi:hypothetical protein
MTFEITDQVRVANPAVEPDARLGTVGMIVGQFKSCYAVKLDDGNNHHWFGEDELQPVD